MNPLDEREARLTTRAAIVAGASFVALYATTGFRGWGYVLAAAIGAVMAGLLWLAARSGRRMLTGLAAVVVGFGPWGAAWVLGAPYLLLGGWLLFRARPRRRTEPAEAADPDARIDAGPAATRRRRRSGTVVDPPAARQRPGASKRYTPPSGR